MNKLHSLYILIICLLPGFLLAQTDNQQARTDSINGSFTYQTGTIELDNGIARLTVPAGFKYLDPAQSKRVVTEVWGNPPAITTAGMLFPANSGPLGTRSWAFNINYEELGYVDDNDADDIDYDDLLSNLQEDTQKESGERLRQGYPAMVLVGWAATPFYDKTHKVLHWAQELKVGDSTGVNSLNYDVRILGRRGVLSLNAIGTMDDISDISANIPAIIGSVAFAPGNRYGDFTDGDKLAAVTIGGLIAGKVLAKLGLFALALKFWKVVLIAVAGGWSVFRRFLSSKKTTPGPDPTGRVS